VLSAARGLPRGRAVASPALQARKGSMAYAPLHPTHSLATLLAVR